MSSTDVFAFGSIFVLVLGSFLFGWICILLSPFMILAGGLLMSVVGAANEMKAHLKSRLLEKNVQRVRDIFNETQAKHSWKSACSCCEEHPGRTDLFLRFENQKESWGHHTHGTSLSSAVLKMSQHTKQELATCSVKGTISGPFQCNGFGKCPMVLGQQQKKRALLADVKAAETEVSADHILVTASD